LNIGTSTSDPEGKREPSSKKEDEEESLLDWKKGKRKRNVTMMNLVARLYFSTKEKSSGEGGNRLLEIRDGGERPVVSG